MSTNISQHSKVFTPITGAIRALAMDAVQQANSGHPGAPMALAPLVYTLWNRVLRFDPRNPIWPNRDRFVLSGGHGTLSNPSHAQLCLGC